MLTAVIGTCRPNLHSVCGPQTLRTDATQSSGCLKTVFVIIPLTKFNSLDLCEMGLGTGLVISW